MGSVSAESDGDPWLDFYAKACVSRKGTGRRFSCEGQEGPTSQVLFSIARVITRGPTRKRTPMPLRPGVGKYSLKRMRTDRPFRTTAGR